MIPDVRRRKFLWIAQEACGDNPLTVETSFNSAAPVAQSGNRGHPADMNPIDGQKHSIQVTAIRIFYGLLDRGDKMEPHSDEVVDFAHGEVMMWVDLGTLHLKCVTKQGDPVELNTHEVVDLMEAIKKCMLRMD